MSSFTEQILTADDIDHGLARFEDGYVLCPILWSGGKCEECYEIFEERSEKYE